MENAKRAQQRLIDRGFDLVVDGDFGARSMAALISHVGARPVVSELRTRLGKAAARHFHDAGIITPLRLAHALAQQSVETGGFSTLVESFNYRVTVLRATFSKKRISDADCQRLGRKDGEAPLSEARQRDIANLVYGGKWGQENLGNTMDGDGWRFRGRGAKQTTGRSNYADVRQVTGLDVVANPDWLAEPDLGMRAAAIYWKKRGCNAFADADDIVGLTKAINGGTNGLEERRSALKRAKSILL